MYPRKTWPSLNEDVLRRTGAAWSWLCAYMRRRSLGRLPAGTTIGQARWSKLALRGTVLLNGEHVWASLGHAVWAVLVLPLQKLVLADTTYYKFTAAAAEFAHILTPGDWSVVPFTAARCEMHGILMKKSGAPIPLMKHCLMNKNDLNSEDLISCGKLLGCTGVGPESTPDDMLEKLGEALKGDDAMFPEVIKAKFYETEDPCAMLKDPW